MSGHLFERLGALDLLAAGWLPAITEAETFEINAVHYHMQAQFTLCDLTGTISGTNHRFISALWRRHASGSNYDLRELNCRLYALLFGDPTDRGFDVRRNSRTRVNH